MNRFQQVSVGLLLNLFLVFTTPVAQSAAVVSPESQGFSSERLSRLHAAMESFVDEGRHAGIVTLIARRGQIVDRKAYGYRNLETEEPMQTDSIFRIYSMTKIVTSVAVLMLLEEGKVALNDPIGRYIPELKSMKVMQGGTASNPILVDAKKEITVKELLTHTSGFLYSFLGNDSIHEIYEQAELWELKSLEEFVGRLSALPLAHHPGEAWTYGKSTNVLGYLVQVVSGQPFEVFMRERIFEPLKMEDTEFFVPLEKRSRLALTYTTGEGGDLEAIEPPISKVEEGAVLPSGGAGLFSTIGDIFRFAQMLLNGGELDGRRILGRKTVELMMSNHLNHFADPTTAWSDSDGFGLGGSVRIDLARGNRLGSVGQFGWTGLATTSVNIDPKEETVVLVFTQHLPYNEHGLLELFNTLYYQALID